MNLFEQELASLYHGLEPVPGLLLSSRSHNRGAHLANQQCKKCQEEVREVIRLRTFCDLLASEPPIDTGKIVSKSKCPNCPNPIKPDRKYCSPTCALVFAAHARRKIDPAVLKILHLDQWLSREETAKKLGVTKGGINTALGRMKLFRKRCPEQCRISGCPEPTYFRKNARGQKVGNTCVDHWRERQRLYVRQYREKTTIPSTPERRAENARQASLIRWTRHRSAAHDPSIADLVRDLLQAHGQMKLQDIQSALGKPTSSICNALKRKTEIFRRLDFGIYALVNNPCS